MKLTDIMPEISTNDLIRVYNSNKEYIYFNISVFNVGVQIRIICSDTYKEINYNNCNGYDFILSNERNLNELIFEELKQRFDTEKINEFRDYKRVKTILENI